ncbi:MAG: flippase-like domain-containing protein [Herpetosiphonaceae bacterium]|nr:flippase-like domain-containing protein [Herpetosiphonaceae bacterium]
MTLVPHLGRRLALSVVLGAIVLAGLSVFTDLRGVRQSFAGFHWPVLGAIIGWTVFNYVLRWAKWEYYLRKLGFGTGVSRLDSGLMFTSGMVMAVTPGKVGEVFKSYLLKRVNGTPIASSAPIVMAERLTDGLGMLLLMAAGLNLYPSARPLFWILVVLGIFALAAVQYKPLAEWLLMRTAETRLTRRIAPQLQAFYDSSFALLSWRLLLISTLLSVISWFGECIALYYVLIGLGIPGDARLLLISTFVFAASTLFGLVSFLPGGLGVSEASSAGLLLLLVAGLSRGGAAAATVLIRFCTLWFGVSLGLIGLLIFEQRYKHRTAVQERLNPQNAKL